MRNIPTIGAAGALLIVLLVYMCTFQVRTTEVAIIKTFGEADRNVITEPGLRLKWPWPIQSVVTYDKRLRILVDRTEETRTADSKNIILTTYAVWTIADPYKFHVSYPNEAEGERALRTKVRSHKMAVAGKHTFNEFVSTEADERRLREIEAEMLALVRQEAAEEFGVDVPMFGIKQLGLPEEVTKAVFTAMKEYEETKAANYKAEGDAAAEQIRADAEMAQERIIAVAQRQVDAIRNQTQGEVARIYQQFREHQDLRIFLDKLDALEEILRKRATLVLEPDIAPVDLFDAQRRLAPLSTENSLEAVEKAAGNNAAD